ncbi:MAG: hypothetical protein KAG89_04575 [Fulvimarina manganoxydans]|uniref:hypothetical protein n=1 Tax=Fulvimarina manganoxydans TaxID=937218 RepID=UPI002354B535|nr:hypothetical protein [Fulvimarina manganoxydans]MCK5931427.1 hypothetical protein [Fulvimarina manganoxydans]
MSSQLFARKNRLIAAVWDFNAFSIISSLWRQSPRRRLESRLIDFPRRAAESVLDKRFHFKRLGGVRVIGLSALVIAALAMSGCGGGADMAEIRRESAYGYPSFQASFPIQSQALSEPRLRAAATPAPRSIADPAANRSSRVQTPTQAALPPADAIPDLTGEDATALAKPVRRSPVYDMERDPTIQAALRVGLKSGDVFALPEDAEGNAILPPIPRSVIVDLSEATRLLGSGETATPLD